MDIQKKTIIIIVNEIIYLVINTVNYYIKKKQLRSY